MSEEDSQSEEIDASKVAADIREYVHVPAPIIFR